MRDADVGDHGAEAVAGRLRAALEAGDGAAVAALFAPGALLDANLPSWRLRRRGPEAIARQIAAWYPHGPARFVEWRTRTADWGAVVECVEVATTGADDLLYREALLLVLDGERIGALTLYCTGAWDAETRRRHAQGEAEEEAAPAA